MKRYTTNDMLLLAWLTTFAALCSPVAALLPEAPKPLKQMPATSFTCAGKVVGGYYADVQAGCRVFHVCTLNEKGGTLDIPFLCVDGTVFDQKTRVCERVDEVDCSISESFYHLNNELYGPGIIPMTASESEGVEKPTTQHALDPTAALMGLAITSSSLPPPSPASRQEASTLPGASSNSNSPFTSPSFNSSSSTFFDFTSIPVEKQQHQQQSHGVSSSSTVVSTSTSSSITTTLTPPDPPFTISRTSSSTSVSSSSRVQIETPLAQISLDQGVDHSSLPAPHLRQTLLRLALQAQNAKILSEHERAPPAPVTLDPPTDFEEVPRLSALSSTSSSHDPIGQPVVPPRQKRQSDPLKQPAANPVRISPSRLLRRPSSASPRPREEAAAAPARVSARRPTRPRLRGRQEEGRERQPVVGRRPSSRRAVITRLSPTRQPSRARTNFTPAQNAVDLPFRREFGPPNVPAAVQDFGDAAPFEVTRPVHRTRPRRPSPSFDSDVVVDRSPLVPEATFVGADPDPPAPPQETTTQAPTPAPIVLPVTSFSCEGRVHGGLYADPEAGCELYHVCSLGPEGKMEDHRFLCGAGTLFDQVNRICRAANEVNCAHATDFYHLNSNPLQAVILSATDFPEHQFNFPRVRQRRADEVLSTNQYLCALLGQNEASGDPAVRCAYYFLCNTHYVQQFKQCENDLSQSGSRCLSQEAVECMNEISGYQEAPYGVPEALRHLKGPIGRRRRSALPSMANLVVVPGTEDARVRRALFSLAALQLWVKENAMHSSFIDMQTIQMKNGPFVKKVESTTGSAPESKIRVLTRLRRQLSDVRDSGDSSLPQASGDATLSIENTTTSSTVAPTTTISTTTTSASPKTTPITPSPEPQVTTEDVPVTSLGPADEQLDVFAFTTLPTLTKVTTPTTPPITTVKVDTLSSISPTTISTPAQDPSVTEETSTSVPSSTQSLLSVMQDSTPSFVDTTTAVSQAKSSSTQLPETSTSNDLPVEKKDQIDEAVDDARQEETPTLTTSTTSSTSTTSTLATMSSLPSTSATPVNMIPPINKASSEVTTVKSQETSPVSDTDQSHTGENDTKAKNTTDPPLTSSVKNTTEPLDGTSNSTEPTPSPGSNRYENVTDQDGVWNETSSPTPKPGQLFTRDNLPETSFTCKDKQLQKFYPDPEVNCQVFHYCSPGFTTDQVLDLKFLCTGPTMFDVKTQKCEDMEQVTCSKAELPPKEECNVTEADKLGDGGPATCDNKTSALPSSVDQNATAITENVTSSASNTTEMPDLSIGSVSTNASAAMVTLDNVTLPHDSSSNASIPSSENIIHNETTDGHAHNDTSADSASESNVTVESSPHNETSDGGDSIQRNTFKSDVVLSTEAHSNDSSHNATKVDDDSIHDTTSSSADAQGELTDVGNSKQDTSSSTDFEEASSSVVEPSQETTPVNDTETKIPPLVPLSSEAPQGLLTSTPSNTETPPSTTSQHALTTEPNLKVTSPPSAEDGNLTEATNRGDPILTSDTVQVQEATEEVHDKKETQPATEQVSAESSKKGSASVELATTIEESVDPANETGSGNETNTTPSPSTPSEPEKNTMLAAHPNDPQGPEEASDSGHESKLQLNVPTTTPSANTSEELKSDLPSDAVLDSTIKVDSQNDTGSVVAGHEGQEASAPSPQPDNTRETVPELSQVDPTGEGQDKNSDKAKEQETISGSTSSGGSETVAGGASPEAPAPTPATAAESS